MSLLLFAVKERSKGLTLALVDAAGYTLNSGAWEGTLSYGGSAPAPLAGATFYGARM